MSLIVEANDYTPLPKKSGKYTLGSFGWIKNKPPEPIRVEEQLPHKDWDRLHELWDSTNKLLENQRYPDQSDFKNVKRQMGKSMPHTELVKRITKLNAKLVAQDSLSMKGSAAFYYVNPDKSLKYTNAVFDIGIVPEFTIMRTDAADLPVHYPKYGWRTCLVRLLKGRYLSWSQVVESFGDVTYSDSRGKHWSLNIKNFRH